MCRKHSKILSWKYLWFLLALFWWFSISRTGIKWNFYRKSYFLTVSWHHLRIHLSARNNIQQFGEWLHTSWIFKLSGRRFRRSLIWRFDISRSNSSKILRDSTPKWLIWIPEWWKKWSATLWIQTILWERTTQAALLHRSFMIYKLYIIYNIIDNSRFHSSLTTHLKH